MTVVKTLLLPKFTHLFISLPKPKDETLKEIETIFYKYIWSNKPDRIARKTLIQNIEFGGCRMIKLEIYIKSLKLTWIRRIIKNKDTVKWIQLFADSSSVDLDLLLKTGDDYILRKINHMTNSFWKETLQYLHELRSQLLKKDKDDILNKPLFYNSDIKIDGRTLFYKKWFERGILLIKDLFNVDGTMHSREHMSNILGSNIPFTTYFGIKIAIFNKWPMLKNSNNNVIQFGPEMPDFIKVICKTSKGSGVIYDFFLSNIQTYPKSCQKWEAIPVFTDQIDWNKIFRNIFNFTSDTKLIWFQYRIVHRIIATNKYLVLIGVKNNSVCNLCNNEIETIEHLFFYCIHAQKFWNDLKTVFENAGITLTLTIKNILFLKFGREFVAENLCIVLGKYYIYRARFLSCQLNIEEFIQNLKQYYKTEKYIYTIKCKNRIFQDRWKNFHNLLI